jgi:hypothetical protein
VTLIELLIVVAVLSVMVAGLGLSTGRGAAPGQTDQARFEDRFEALRSLAVHGGVPRGLVIELGGLRQAEYGADGWQVSDHLMRWRGRVAHRVLTGGGGATGPTLVFLPNGQTSAFRISFAGAGAFAGASPVTRCTSDGWTGLQCSAG